MRTRTTNCLPSPFRFDRTWHFGVIPCELWTTLSHTDRYREWWPWLREFTVDGDGPALTTGAVAHVVIQAPLPYQLHCTVRVLDAVPDERLVTVVDGDLRGPARLELLDADGTGTEARLVWELDCNRRSCGRGGRSPGDGVGARPHRRTRPRAVRRARAAGARAEGLDV